MFACSLQTKDVCSLVIFFPPSPFKKLQNRNDPNLSNVPGDHPFINAAALETEGVTLLQRLITDLYTKQYVRPVVSRLYKASSCVALLETRTLYLPF